MTKQEIKELSDKTTEQAVTLIQAATLLVADYITALPQQSADWIEEQKRNVDNLEYHANQILFWIKRITANDRTVETKTKGAVNGKRIKGNG